MDSAMTDDESNPVNAVEYAVESWEAYGDPHDAMTFLSAWRCRDLTEAEQYRDWCKVSGRKTTVLHFVFDGPPSPEGVRFIECESPDGKSINAGEWRERSDGLWELIVKGLTPA